MTRKEPQPGFRMNLPPAMNPDAATDLIRLFSNKKISAVYFDSQAALEQDSHTWKLIAIVTGHNTTLQETPKGTKKGRGSGLLFQAEDTPNIYSVLPNDGNVRDAEYRLTLDKISNSDLVPDDLKQKIRNAIRTNLSHRREHINPFPHRH